MRRVEGVHKRGKYWYWYWQHKEYTDGKQIERGSYASATDAQRARRKYILKHTPEYHDPIPRRRKTSCLGWVYLLKMNQYYKIGRTTGTNPKSRIQSISASLPCIPELIHLFQTSDAADAEARLHKRYSHYRTNGEWFQLSQETVIQIQCERGDLILPTQCHCAAKE